MTIEKPKKELSYELITEDNVDKLIITQERENVRDGVLVRTKYKATLYRLEGGNYTPIDLQYENEAQGMDPKSVQYLDESRRADDLLAYEMTLGREEAEAVGVGIIKEKARKVTALHSHIYQLTKLAYASINRRTVKKPERESALARKRSTKANR